MIKSFLLIGQSNMAGRGNIGDVEPICNDNIFMFRNGGWIPAKEPIHDDKPELCGIGLAMSFANELQRELNEKIGLIPCAFGGTLLSQWEKGGELYSSAVNKTLEASKQSQFTGILWHQGESDSESLEAVVEYKNKFLDLINSLSLDLSCQDIGIIMGELGRFLCINNSSVYWKELIDVFREICNENINYGLVSSESLIDMGDLLHFDSVSLREFGIRYARAWISLQNTRRKHRI